MPSAAKANVLNYIWNRPGTHRKQIATHFGLHPNVVSDAMRVLIKEKWVVEQKAVNPTVGRTPIELRIDGRNHAALAVNYTHDSMICGLVNADGEVLLSKTLQHDLRNPDEIVALAAKHAAELRKKYRGAVIGIAVADPGMIDCRKGAVVRSSSFPGWRNVGLAEMFNAGTKLEAIVVDVTHARAMAQYRLLAEHARQADTMLYIDYGAGTIGFTFITPQGIWKGEGFAGEMGHVTIDPGGAICRCGARGCLENRTNSQALENQAAALLKKNVHSILKERVHPGALDIFSAASGGDRFAQTVVHDVLAELGLYVAAAVAMCHPKTLVIGAETDDAIGVLAGEMKQAVASRLPFEIASTVAVANGRPINPLGLIGAGLMMFEKTIRK
jgi:glucokinase